MATITITPAQLPALLAKCGREGLAAVQRGLLSGAMRTLPELDKRTRTAPPASERGKPGAFNTGYYARAWTASRVANGARVYNKAPYAGVIEWGRRAGARQPPSAPFVAWAKRRMGLSDKEAKRVAFLIARAIGRRGLRARRVLTGDQPAMTALVTAEVNREVAAALAKVRP